MAGIGKDAVAALLRDLGEDCTNASREGTLVGATLGDEIVWPVISRIVNEGLRTQVSFEPSEGFEGGSSQGTALPGCIFLVSSVRGIIHLVKFPDVVMEEVA